MSKNFDPKLERFLKVMLTSDQHGEMMTARDFVMREASRAGMDVHAFVDHLLGASKPCFSDAQLTEVYQAGFTAGYAKANRSAGPSGWQDADTTGSGTISWKNAAKFCHKSELYTRGGLKNKEMEFIYDMIQRMGRWPPTRKQAEWLHDLYKRCGGTEKVE